MPWPRLIFTITESVWLMADSKVAAVRCTFAEPALSCAAIARRSSEAARRFVTISLS